MNHAEKAVEYYSNNFNCSQGVFTTYARKWEWMKRWH
jgi:hypothetical protein